MTEHSRARRRAQRMGRNRGDENRDTGPHLGDGMSDTLRAGLERLIEYLQKDPEWSPLYSDELPEWRGEKSGRAYAAERIADLLRAQPPRLEAFHIDPNCHCVWCKKARECRCELGASGAHEGGCPDWRRGKV